MFIPTNVFNLDEAMRGRGSDAESDIAPGVMVGALSRRLVCTLVAGTLGGIILLASIAIAAPSPSTAAATAAASLGRSAPRAHPMQPAGHQASQITQLSPIVVEGHKIPMPVALQMLKNALHRPWSSTYQDRNVVVCHTPQMMGSHFHTLRCETNGAHFREQEATQMDLFLAGATYSGGLQGILSGQIPVMAEVANWANQHRINAAVLRALLAKLPPPGTAIRCRSKTTARWSPAGCSSRASWSASGIAPRRTIARSRSDVETLVRTMRHD